MWCIGELTAEYRRRMYELLAVYARPYDPREPVICLDEKSKQLLRETRRPLPAKPGTPAKVDYEYERAGTCNIFVAVEPRGQRRLAQVTARRTKVDFVGFVCRRLPGPDPKRTSYGSFFSFNDPDGNNGSLGLHG